MKKILPLSLFLLLFCASAVFGVDVYDYLNFYNNYISASNVTIDVKSNITFLASPSGTPTWPNNVANNKIINGLGDGGGRYELIGNNLSYGLVVENINSSYSPRTLSINNIIIRNMRAANGAIYLYSRRNQPDSHITLNIYNVDFDSNNRAINTFYGTATNARSIIINAGGTNVFLNNTFAGAGGAINLVARTITAFTNSDTTFIGNSATGASGLGGAIYMTGGTSAGIESLLNFTNSNITFSGNSAGGSGGVIYLADRTTATFTNSTVIFTGNSAVSDGGAIYIFGTNNSFLNFANSNLTFTSNTSRSGGAIYVADSGSRLSFLGSAVTAIGNQANGTGVNGNGGFLYLNGQSVTFDRNVNLTSNTANRSGGGIYAAAAGTMLTFTGNTMTFNYNKASGNGSGSGGGAMYLADRTTATFTNSTVIFTGNSAVMDGGAINIAGPNNSFLNFANSNLTFTSNTANNGGAIYAGSGSRLSFLGSALTATGNNAGSYGGFLYLNGQSVTFDRDVNLISNTAAINGGGIYAAAGTSLTFTGNTKTFNYNTATFGGAMYLDRTNTIFTNSTVIFTGNRTTGASGLGGAIYMIGTAGNVSFLDFTNSNVTFSGNSAGNNGGAMYLADRTTTTFTNSTVIFTGNNAVNDGGAIYLSGTNNSFLNFANSNLTFTSNTANNGGAVYAGSGSRLSFLGSTLIAKGNTAVTYGGFLYLYGQSITFNQNVELISNTAQQGGAIYAAANGSVITFSGLSTVINYNRSTSASGNGVIHLGGNSTLDFLNTALTAIGNESNNGGFLYLYNKGTMTFTKNVNMSSNTARSFGGALYLYYTTLNFNNNNISMSYNEAKNGSGGAIYSDTSWITFSNTNNITFNNNRASVSGGAIYYGGNSTLNFVSSLVNFINNSANFGGAVFAGSNSNTSFSGGKVNFEGNQAGTLGGALYITNSAVTFNTNGGEVIFSGNKANGKPNDVYMDVNSTLNISGSNLIRFEGGILSAVSGSGISINKSGSGAMYLGGDSEVWGNFNITGGNIIMLASATYRGKALELPLGSALSMENGTVNTVTVQGNFRSLTNLKMDIFYDGTNDVIKANTAYIGGNIDIFAGVGTYDNTEYQLIITSGPSNLTGVFTSSSISKADGGDLRYELKYENGIVKLIINGLVITNFGGLSPLTYNQSETARAFDAISVNPGAWQLILTEMMVKQNNGTEAEIAEVKRFLAETSGYFLSNVIRNIAADSPKNEVYDKIKNHGEEHKTNSGLWVQLKGGMESFKEDENSPEDYKDVSMGVMFGFDRFMADKLGGDMMWGVYGRISKDNIEQGSHKADGNKNGLGVYGGYTRDSLEFKGMLLGSYDKFSTERMTYGGRTTKADINAITVSADVEAALRIWLTEVIDLKPYLGIEVQNTMYEGFNEIGAGMYNLEVSGGTYLRSAGRVGFGVDYDKDIWIWYGNIECKYMFAGTTHEIEGQFVNTGMKFFSRSSEEGSIAVGIGAGGEVRLSENWKGFVNVKYYAGDRYENMYGNAGVRWIFSARSRDIKAQSREASYEAKEKAKIHQEEKKRMESEFRISEKIMTGPETFEKEKASEKKEAAKQKAEAVKKAKEEARMLNAEIKAYEKAMKEDMEVQRREASYEAKEKAKSQKEEKKKMESEFRIYDKTQKDSEKVIIGSEAFEKEKASGEKETAKQKAESEIKAYEKAMSEIKPAETKVKDTRILEYEIMLAAAQKQEEEKIKAEKEQARNEMRQRQIEQAKAEKARGLKFSGEISDDELMKKKNEIQGRMLKPILESFEIKFMSDSYELSQHWRNELQKQIEAIKKYEYNKISIEGHADSTENTPKKLSRLRAKAVYDEFINNGIPAEKIEYVGLSSILPAASNDDEAGRMVNRRVVVVVE